MIAEISESDAQGATAGLYEDIRQTMGLPIVNLLYRHLAAVDLLTPVWSAVRPALESGAISRGIPLVSRNARALSPPTWNAATVFNLLGIDRATRRQAERTVLAYQDGNTANLVILHALRRCLRNGEDTLVSTVATGDSARSANIGVRLPPAPPKSDISPEVWSLIQALSTQHGGDVIPTLYRHFALTPQLLAVTAVLLCERDVTAGGAAFAKSAQRQATTLPLDVRPLLELSLSRRRELIDIIELFIRTIADMLFVISLLDDLLKPPS